ncbi:50S ribosomal protein L25/general stress protein Ctc (plasmid) [Geminicoccaceae bacterium 1502E]|nr:50S ribosomal protein L25/general stress protein Ctc [Geminicoccaceae bacterium 1502E]
MSQSHVLNAEQRELSGKGPARRLRAVGRLPAILYGGGDEVVKLSLELKQVKRELTHNSRFFSTVFDLEIDGKVLHALPREAQFHPVTEEPLHIDFLRAERGAMLTVSVPVRFANEEASPGLKRGGVLNIVRREVELVCPADAIPDELVADLTGFDVGDTVHVSHVAMPDRVHPTITDRDFTIASIVPPTVTPAAEAESAEEGAEG